MQELIKLIFDLKMMKNTLIQMEFDISRSPLGKLKKSQILLGYDILGKLQGKKKFFFIFIIFIIFILFLFLLFLFFIFLQSTLKLETETRFMI